MNHACRIEFVLPLAFLNEALNLLEQAGVEGYTAMEVRQGKGKDQGEHQLEGAIATSRNMYIVSFCEESQGKAAYASLEKLFKRVAGFVALSSVECATTFNKQHARKQSHP